ncbi:Swt1 family HEPN domain-containing protein [Microbacterium sp. 22242]|uniref:Swt1 family HEPN domain-containing protein n=1 Tax=Microbacterium sp. 22242 TaxID=3453896 RepID=UPI003F844BE6
MTTEFDPRYSIDRVFQCMAERLGPVIAGTLAPHLGALPWTAMLAEMDKLKGKPPGVYLATDPQAQLRVLTERLGGIGFPFDDHTRTVSVLGGELRIARNRWAHYGDLDALDAWRTNDFVVRLLERLGDAEGAAQAVASREEAFDAVVREKRSAEHAVPTEGAAIDAPIANASFALVGKKPTPATSSPGSTPAQIRSSGSQADTTPVASTGASLEGESVDGGDFEPWLVVAVGGPEVVDGLPKKVMKEQVRAVASEIVDYEGPVQLKRLAQLTAASFGIKRLHEAREKKLIYQIRQAEGIVVDSDKFVWPRDVDPAAWRGYRPNGADMRRDLLAISPVEIANAIRDLRSRRGAQPEAEEDRAILRLFGKSRLTAAFHAHIGRARQLLADSIDPGADQTSMTHADVQHR